VLDSTAVWRVGSCWKKVSIGLGKKIVEEEIKRHWGHLVRQSHRHHRGTSSSSPRDFAIADQRFHFDPIVSTFLPLFGASASGWASDLWKKNQIIASHRKNFLTIDDIAFFDSDITSLSRKERPRFFEGHDIDSRQDIGIPLIQPYISQNSPICSYWRKLYDPLQPPSDIRQIHPLQYPRPLVFIWSYSRLF